MCGLDSDVKPLQRLRPLEIPRNRQLVTCTRNRSDLLVLMVMHACAGGFSAFPTLGIKALANTWNFDFQQTYVGAGMICPLIIDWSIMLGGIACYVRASAPMPWFTVPKCPAAL